MKAAAVVCLSALGLLLGGLASTATADPRTNYVLDCRGCHGADGAGVPGKVPDMRNSLARLSATPAGRRYLVEVPGVAQAPLSDLELAQLLNWITRHLSAVPEPTGFEPFTAHEVASYRKTPLVAVAAIRQRLLTGSPRSASSRR
jgi:cytochrome c553